MFRVGFFDALNGGLETMFKEISKSKRLKNNRRQGYLEYLQNEQQFLVDSSFLLELADGANKEETDIILDYMYRFNNRKVGEEDHLNILGIDSYKEVENQIINKRWK
jgi:hypothetical protein